MNLLLDTHALIWWLLGDAKLSRPARQSIDDENNDILVSGATAWEIATKFRKGKLPTAGGFATNLAAIVVEQGFLELAITIRHACHAGLLPPPLRDPFDRMLVAQSLLENLPLISNETVFDRYGINRIW